MQPVRYIAYRVLTTADWFNIYKLPGTETGGGGQLYIDFPTSAITIDEWHAFFGGVRELTITSGAKGPRWTCPVHSIGVDDEGSPQQLRMYQRRPQTVCVGHQNLHTRRGERLLGWHPGQGFPKPRGVLRRGVLPPPGLTVYLVRTFGDEVWAGWFQRSNVGSLSETKQASERIEGMMTASGQMGEAGMITFTKGTLFLNGEDARPTFATIPQRDVDDSVIDGWFDEDDFTRGSRDRKSREHVRVVRDRNRRAVGELKSLYRYQCQITGDEFVFVTKDGVGYVEAHHLIPLGKGGDDHAHNIVIVSAHTHRMLHCANVGPIDLSKITTDKKGWGVLAIEINGIIYSIRWHPRHLDVVQKYQKS